MKFKCLFILPLLASLVSCVSGGGFEELEDPSEPQGPGVFTGQEGEFNFNEFFSDEGQEKRFQEKLRERGYTANPNLSAPASSNSSSGSVSIPAIGEESFREFEEFKAWRRAQDPNSPNYQEYQDFRAYQQYLRFKQQQQTPQDQPN